MLQDSQGRRLWIVDERGRHAPVFSSKDIQTRPRGGGEPDWWVVARPRDWTPPEPRSLLSLGAAAENSAEVSGGGTASGTKIGAGGKPQPYGWHGRYTGPSGGSIPTGGGRVRLFANGADGVGEGQDQEEASGEGSGGEPRAEAEQEAARGLEGVLVADSGRVVSDAGGSAPGTDNEAWRLKEKQYSPEKLAQNARADLGSDKWYPKQVHGETKNQCNIFVADKLHESGAPVPNVGGRAGTLGAEASDRLNTATDGRIGGQPPSANDWFKGKVPGYDPVGGAPRPGDIAASASHVGIVSGAGKTVSVTTLGMDYGHVVENEWGFRPGERDGITFWRFTGPRQGKQ